MEQEKGCSNMCVYVSYVDVSDLNKFLEYLKLKGIDLEEYSHTVLVDSSEFEIIVCRKGTSTAYMFVHYINTHYANLSDLNEGASDRDVLQALLSVSRRNLWRIPVEPVIYVANGYDFAKLMNSYIDKVPELGRNYLEKYTSSRSSLKKVIDIDAVLDIAYGFKLINGEPPNETLRS